MKHLVVRGGLGEGGRGVVVVWGGGVLAGGGGGKENVTLKKATKSGLEETTYRVKNYRG